MARRTRRQPRSKLWPLEAILAPAPQPPASPLQARLMQRLHALADAVSGYLRYHPDRTVRRSVALLAAAALAASTACGSATDTLEPAVVATVARAAPQANAGFPTAPGEYQLRPASLQMDTGGTYYLWWYTSGSGGALNLARGSNVKLVEDDRTFLQVQAGAPPILHLKTEEPVALVAATSAGQPQTAPTSGANEQRSGGAGFMSPWMWYPFFLTGGGTNTVIVERDRPVDRATTRTPGYYAPPSTDIEPGGQVRGGTRSASAPSSAPSFQLKTTTVSGRAGGTGSGTAATAKSGDSATRVGAPRNSGFSSGTGSGSSGSSIS